MRKPTGRPRGRPPGAKNRPPVELATPEGTTLPAKPRRTSGPKKGPGEAVPPTVGSAISDAQIEAWYGQVLEAKLVVEKHDGEMAKIREERNSANGTYRNILKAIEKTAGPEAKKALIWRLEKRGEDVQAIDRQHSWNNRVAALTGLPIGTQLGLFPDGTTVASKVDTAAIGHSSVPPFNASYTTAELTDAAWAGTAAAEKGETRDSCPYELGTPLADRWYVGWDDEHKRQVQVGQGPFAVPPAAPATPPAV